MKYLGPNIQLFVIRPNNAPNQSKTSPRIGNDNTIFGIVLKIPKIDHAN